MVILRVVVHLIDDRLPAADSRGGKGVPHGRNRRGFELLAVDIRIGLSDRPAELVEDLLAPPDRVGLECPKGEQEVPQRR